MPDFRGKGGEDEGEDHDDEAEGADGFLGLWVAGHEEEDWGGEEVCEALDYGGSDTVSNLESTPGAFV